MADEGLEKIMDARQKAFEKVVETKVDALGDKVQTSLDSVKNTMDNLQDTIVGSVKGFNKRLDSHEKEDKKEFSEVRDRVVESEGKIIKIMAIGGIVLIVMGWIANALIQKHDW